MMEFGIHGSGRTVQKSEDRRQRTENKELSKRSRSQLSLRSFTLHPLHFTLFVLLIPAAACQEQTPISAPEETIHPEWGSIFDAHDATGTMVMLDAETGTRHVFNPERASERFSPASTFKVYNSLVALETGVVPNVDTMYAWDGVERGGAWDQDHSLRMGMRNSTVWLFQKLAEQIGKAPYEQAFAREPYGNGMVGDSIRTFWLGEPLAISANEQVAYLDKLRLGALSFRPEVQEAVREIMILEEAPEYTLYGKTGWTWTEEDRSDEIGWIVGWIERGDEAWVYVLNTVSNGPDFDMRTARRGILDGVLAEMELGPPEPRD